MTSSISPIGTKTQIQVQPTGSKKPQEPIQVPRTSIMATPLSFITLPYDFVKTAIAWVKAENKKDTEGRMDAAIRLAAAPVSFLHKAQTSLSFLAKVSAILGINLDFFKLPGSFTAWFLPASILGSVLCVIEGVYEGVSIARVLDLKEHIPATYNPKEYLREWQYLHDEHFSLSDKEISDIQKMVSKKFPGLDEEKALSKCEELKESLLAVKKDNLSRRVRPWLANEMGEKIKPLLEGLKSIDPEKRTEARREVEKIFKNMDIQCKKKLLVHTIGLIALAFTAVGFLLATIACPALFPIVFLGLGGVITFFRYMIENGYQDQKGWHFSPYDCLPSWMRWLHGKACTSSKEAVL